VVEKMTLLTTSPTTAILTAMAVQLLAIVAKINFRCREFVIVGTRSSKHSVKSLNSALKVPKPPETQLPRKPQFEKKNNVEEPDEHTFPKSI
jgi:hypothetical protein